MLPFMAQGAAQAIEDGAALAACLTRADGVRVAEALRAYEAIRRPRASRIQAMSKENKRRFHLPDGPDQEERDAQMSGGSDWSFAAVEWIYGHDAAVIDAGAGLRE